MKEEECESLKNRGRISLLHVNEKKEKKRKEKKKKRKKEKEKTEEKRKTCPSLDFLMGKS